MKFLAAIRMRWVVWAWTHTPNCAEMSRLASQSFEQPPPLGMRLRMRLHYLICIWCERYAKHLKFLHRAAPGLEEHLDHHPRPRLSDDAKRRMAEKLRQTGGPLNLAPRSELL